jgi:hypothetical protein
MSGSAMKKAVRASPAVSSVTMRARMPSEATSGAPLIAAWKASFCPRIRFSLVHGASSARACWTATLAFFPSDVKRSWVVDPPLSRGCRAIITARPVGHDYGGPIHRSL